MAARLADRGAAVWRGSVSRPAIKIYTIGFTRSSAEHFFTRLKESKARRLVDVRLNNVPQLAGFAKRDDLRYFAQRRIEQMDRDELAGACLLCSEDTPHHCHRRLVAEYLRDKWGDVEIVHL